MRDRMEECLNETQKNIAKTMSDCNEKEGSPFPWRSEEKHSSGKAIYFKGGKIIESGCVNVTTSKKAPVVKEMIQMLPEEHRHNFSKCHFFATGMSLIFHPHSPLIPTIHANYRYFEIEDASQNIISWYFGGGTDLAPSYLFVEDAVHFHSTLKATCDRVDSNFYHELKKNADVYFYIPHRKECRGIGGTFTLRLSDKPKEVLYDWAYNSCRNILNSYLPIVEKRIVERYTEAQKKWQLFRRGRYAEFVLLCDVGVRFGINSGIAVPENILMAMPPLVSWDYLYQVEPNSPEEKLVEVLRNPRDWV